MGVCMCVCVCVCVRARVCVCARVWVYEWVIARTRVRGSLRIALPATNMSTPACHNTPRKKKRVMHHKKRVMHQKKRLMHHKKCLMHQKKCFVDPKKGVKHQNKGPQHLWCWGEIGIDVGCFKEAFVSIIWMCQSYECIVALSSYVEDICRCWVLRTFASQGVKHQKDICFGA